MKLIPLTLGKFAQVDDENYEWLNQWKWCAIKSRDRFYAQRKVTINGKTITILMHILIMGDNPLKLDIDHKFGDGLDNQRHNLRFCTRSENCMNAKPRKNCSSKYKGVYWHKLANKWMAYIQINGRRAHLGLFTLEEDAARSYDTACIKNFGEFARPNFAI